MAKGSFVLKLIIIIILISGLSVGGYFLYAKLTESSGSSSDTKKPDTSTPDTKVPVPAPVVCPPFASYSGSDVAGFDFKTIKDKTEDECKNECLSNGCQWYTYNTKNKACYLKKSKETKDVITGFRLPGSPSSCNQYAVYGNSDIPGFNMPSMPLENKTQDECQAECTHKECHWYNYNSTTKKCWLKKAASHTDSITGILAPIKK